MSKQTTKARALVLAQPRADLVLHGIVDAVRVPGVFDERTTMLVFASHEEATWENAAYYPVGTALPTTCLVGVVTVSRTTTHKSPWLQVDPTEDEVDDNGESTILVIRDPQHVRPQQVRRLPKQCGAMDPEDFDLGAVDASTRPKLLLPEVEPCPGQIFALLSAATLRRLAEELEIEPLPKSEDGIRRRLAIHIKRECEEAIGLLERDEAQLLWTAISGDDTLLALGDLHDQLITACGETDPDSIEADDDNLIV